MPTLQEMEAALAAMPHALNGIQERYKAHIEQAERDEREARERQARQANKPRPQRGIFVRDNLPSVQAYTQMTGLQGPKERSNTKWKTYCCPVHNGWSLRIQQERGSWACMNCGEGGGDVLSLHQWATGLDFISAAKELGAWLEDPNAPMISPERRDRLSASDTLYLIERDVEAVMFVAMQEAHAGNMCQEAKELIKLAAHRCLKLIESRRH